MLVDGGEVVVGASGRHEEGAGDGGARGVRAPLLEVEHRGGCGGGGAVEEGGGDRGGGRGVGATGERGGSVAGQDGLWDSARGADLGSTDV